MTETSAQAGYRRIHKRGAATAVALAVVLATLAGGYLVAEAITVQRSARAAPMIVVTRKVATRSVSRVIDERLDEARLKILLGIAEATQSPQAELAKIAQEVGQPVQNAGLTSPKSGGADYLVKAIKARGAELSSRV